jgi:hypothetical protein
MSTYKNIQSYVKRKYGFVPKTCWIAHAKELCGIPVRTAPNRGSQQRRQELCLSNKLLAIKDAFRHFGLL